jgi:hypothetical protein
MSSPKFIKGPYTEGEIMGILGPKNRKNISYLHDIQPVPNYNGKVIIPTHSNSEGSYTNSQRSNSQRSNNEGSFNNTISKNSNIVSHTPSNSPNKPKTKNKGKGSRKSRIKLNIKSKKNKSRKEANKNKTKKINRQRREKAKERIFNSNQ